MSHEFQVLADTGEDALLACDACAYAANVEEARSRPPETATPSTLPLEKVATPAKRTIEEVAQFLKKEDRDLVKTLIYLADGKPVAVLVRGDRSLNEIKLKAALKAKDLVLAADKVVEEVTGAAVGFAGPIGLTIPIYCDLEVCALPSFVCGANQVDTHYLNVVSKRDFQPTVCGEFRQAGIGDPCPRCAGGHFIGYRGIEVGHVFFLGTKYSAPMRCQFLDVDGKEKPMIMGCYGIGVTRIAAAAIEQNHDQDGIRWPVPIAPYEVALLSLQANDPQVVATSDLLYAELTKLGIEVLFDDRDERPGVKFKDADLIGLPYRIAVGKKGVAEGMVELKSRRSPEVEKVKIEELAQRLANQIIAERAGNI
jgi:prolyl-tRNA synthetase